MSRKTVLIACGLLIVTALSLFAVAHDGAEKKTVSLDDFDWTVSKIRSEVSVKRHPATCAFLWGPDKEDFKPDKGTLSIATITLRARKTGRLELTPEFFLMSDRDNYRLCQGVRAVDPKPACGEAFFPPSAGRGLEIYYLDVTAGQSIVIELVFNRGPFTGQLREGEQILAASRVVTVAGLK